MQKWLGLGTAVALGAVLGVGCSTAQADKYPSYDSMCVDVAAQECQIAQTCLVDRDVCRSARKQICLTNATTAISAGRKYNPQNAQACVDKTSSTYGKPPPITPADLAALTDTCQRVYDGAVDKGGTCASDYDCAGGRVCTLGHCGDKTVKGKGDGCANPGDTCDPAQNLFCQAQTGTSVCVARAAKGAACSPTFPCESGLRCQTVCVDGAGLGQPCGTNDDCATAAPYCDQALGGECTTGLSFAPKAADCAAYGAPSSVPDAGGQDAGAPSDAGPG